MSREQGDQREGVSGKGGYFKLEKVPIMQQAAEKFRDQGLTITVDENDKLHETHVRVKITPGSLTDLAPFWAEVRMIENQPFVDAMAVIMAPLGEAYGREYSSK
jgi:hypothetical protein